MKDTIFVIAVFLIAAGALIYMEDVTPPANVPHETKDTFNILEDDIFALELDDFRTVTYDGIALGATMEEIVEKMGAPDDQPAYQDGTVNLYYGKRMGYDKTVVLFHLEDNKLTRMTFFSPLP